jgi:hypothetical protein
MNKLAARELVGAVMAGLTEMEAAAKWKDQERRQGEVNRIDAYAQRQARQRREGSPEARGEYANFEFEEAVRQPIRP